MALYMMRRLDMDYSQFDLRRRPGSKATAISNTLHRGAPRHLRIEPLEQRTLLSATAIFDHIAFHPPLSGISEPVPATNPYPATALIPSEMQTAYGVNAISLGGVSGTGSGQTIAIVDVYDDPNIVSDAAAFNTEFALQQFNVSGRTNAQSAEPDRRHHAPDGLGHVGLVDRGIARCRVGALDRP
jgi:hypothetical protein